MAACPACGTDNPAEARFCSSCGASLGAACRRCGTDLPGDARFCPSCGLAVAPEVPGQEPGQERKLVTVLFADVTGSTALGERLDAEALRDVMDAYFEAMRQEIEAEGGTVEKFIGDAVMAAFGVPVAHEDDPARAVRAAVRMRRRLEALNGELEQAHGVRLEMRIGVNTGEVLAVTSPRPGEAMVTGDAVNTAARLQESSEPGQTVVGERTARAARGYRFRNLGPLQLPGKADAVPAFALLEEQEEEPALRPERGVSGLGAPMVGRDAELSVLMSVYDRVAQEGRPHLVTVFGDPGVGKTRLVAEFLSAVEDRVPAPQVLRGRCLPYGEGVTFWPLAEILKGVASILETDPPEVALEKVRKVGRELFTPDVAADPERATEALAYTVGVEDPTSTFGDLSPRQVSAETHAAWRSFFSVLAREWPVAAVVEDIHWADPAMLDLLEALAERAEGPVLLLCLARPELIARRPEWGGGRRNYSSVTLDPLSAEDSDHLVGLLLSVEDLPEELHRRILERAEGNPFFLEEIVRQLIDQGSISREDGRWRAAGELLDVAIPDTVQGVLAARMDLLEPGDKRALQFAAVVGRVFWSGAVAHLLDRPDADEALARLEARDLILGRLGSAMAGQREYLFRHVLTRDVAYESLPRRDRADAHARVARWLEETVGDRVLEHAEVLAHHFVQAHDGHAGTAQAPGETVEELRAGALRYLLLAAERARRRLVGRQAQRFAEQALELARDPRERALALEALGEAHNIDYRGDQAWRNLSAAAEARLAETPQDRRAIARLCARAVEVPTRWPGSMEDVPTEEEVRRYLELGLSHVGEEDSPELVGLLSARAFWPFSFRREDPVPDQELREAVQAGERAAEMALRIGRPALASAALDGVASCFVTQGLYGKAREVVDRRLDLAQALEDPWELGDIYAMAVWAHFYLGNYGRALELANEGLGLLPPEAAGMDLHCTAWRGLVRVRLGDWDGFFADLARIQELLGERGTEPPNFAARPFAAAAFVHEVQGNPAAADRFLALVEALDDRHGEVLATARSPWVALALARRGDFEGARARLWAPSVDAWREAYPLVLEARCEVVAAEEAWERAPELLVLGRAFANESGVRSLPCFLDRLEGRMALARKENLKAGRLLAKAAAGFAELEARWEEACTELSLAEALLRSREKEAARERVEHAFPVLERLSSVRELVYARDLLARSG